MPTTPDTRFFVTCTVCDGQWVEEGGDARQVGADHNCAYFDGFEAQYGCRAERRPFLKVVPLKVVAGKRHRCGDDCTHAVSATCRCACGGENHGIGRMASYLGVA